MSIEIQFVPADPELIVQRARIGGHQLIEICDENEVIASPMK